MAFFASHIRRSASKLCNNGKYLALYNQRIILQKGVRSLYSASALGMDTYQRQRAYTLDRVGDLKDKFCSRMDSYLSAADKNTIFTDDLKTIVYIAETEAEYEITAKMFKRFHTQNQDLRFSNFVFGPIVLRMFHNTGEAEMAYELFKDEELAGFFDQMSSYVILMDLLFEKEQYSSVLDMLDLVSQKQLGGFRYPHDCVTLALAACSKMDTPDAFEWTMTLLQNLKKNDTTLSMRSVVYGAKLAHSQGKSDTALEILSLIGERPAASRLPMAYINMKALVYTGLGRLEEAVQILRSIIEIDQPDTIARGGEVFVNTIENLQQAVQTRDEADLTRQFDLVKKGLTQGSHISQIAWEDYIYRPIFRNKKYQESFNQRRRGNYGGRRQMATVSYRGGLAKGEEQLFS